MFPQHLISTQDMSRQDIISVLDSARSMSQIGQLEHKKSPLLRGKTVVNVFFENSTRTRTSFEVAAKRLSADVINFSAQGSSLAKGESLQDTAQTLQAMGADAVVLRHSASGAATQLAESGWIDAAVINAGDGTHEHPTQALLDAYTMREKWGDSSFTGRSIVMVGDILHSRVARSNMWLLSTLGAQVHMVAPPTLLPWGMANWPVHIHNSFDQALEHNFDAIMMLRVQAERMNGGFFPSQREYHAQYGLTPERFARFEASAHDDALLLHPGPMNRGLEISSVAADSPRAVILDQVANGIATRMAVMYHVLAGNHRQGESHE